MIYYWIEETLTDHGDDLIVDKINKIITRKHKNGFMYNTCYSNNVIDINDTSIIQYKWTFTISTHQRSICIGIDLSNNKDINSDFGCDMNKNAFYCTGSNHLRYNYNNDNA